MRELKFRVWNKKEKKFEQLDNFWVSADNLYKCFMEWHPEIDGEMVFETNETYFIFQQYTGLKDKNGKEIYEGDVIKYHRVFESKRGVIELTSCIKFQNGAFGFDMKGFNDMFMSLGDDSDIEVIGNIFENNELLEK
jgi:uncharacterized phage protein (TIGR01671 family)